jgi:hypothetical protein
MREIVIVAVACFLIGMMAYRSIGALKAAANNVLRTQIHGLATRLVLCQLSPNACCWEISEPPTHALGLPRNRP